MHVACYIHLNIDILSLLLAIVHQYSLNYKTLLACGHGEIRLMGGRNKFEGNVQVCIYGEWMTVCSNGWDNEVARAVCTELGFSGDLIRRFSSRTI